jgi:hypothetical protein
MIKFQLKSGKHLELNLAPIDKALALYRAIIFECKGNKVKLDKLIEAIKAVYTGTDSETGVSMLDILAENKEAILSIIGSEYVMNAIQECCEKVLYDKQRFSLELFEDKENRADFFGVMVIVALENLSPFFYQTPTYFTMLSAPFLK